MASHHLAYVPLDSCLSRLFNVIFLCSARPDLVISLSSMPPNMVRLHDGFYMVVIDYACLVFVD